MTASPQSPFGGLAQTPANIELVRYGRMQATSSGPQRPDDILTSPEQVHRHEELLAKIVTEGAAPFVSDSDIFITFLHSRTERDIANAYQALMVRRLGLPEWFAAAMPLEEMVRTWRYTLACLTDRRGGRVVLSDTPDQVIKTPMSIYNPRLDKGDGKNAVQTPQQVWGNGPVSTMLHIPVMLLEPEHVEHQSQPNWYGLQLGYVGGVDGGMHQDLPRSGDPAYEADFVAQAVVPDHPPMLMRVAVQERCALGCEWELRFNGAR